MRPIASRSDHSARHGEDRRINVTPLIDVVMVMIVFFLIVGKLAADERSAVDLPPADAPARPADASPIIININPDGAIVLRGRTIPPNALGSELRTEAALHPDLAVQIRADRTLTYEAIQPVVSACRASGITTVRLAATEDSPSQGGEP